MTNFKPKGYHLKEWQILPHLVKWYSGKKVNTTTMSKVFLLHQLYFYQPLFSMASSLCHSLVRLIQWAATNKITSQEFSCVNQLISAFGYKGWEYWLTGSLKSRFQFHFLNNSGSLIAYLPRYLYSLQQLARVAIPTMAGNLIGERRIHPVHVKAVCLI